MPLRPLGQTGLSVPPLGLGAGPLGARDLPEADAAALLNAALDLGITLIDTARSYGLSEERIGRHLSRRRGEFVLSTKGGYGVEGVPDWSPEAVALGINRALRTLRTDRIDIFHLHACPREVLAQEEILRALEAAQQEGKVRVLAYAGEGDPLGWAVGSGLFGAVETSVNLVDQRSLQQVLPLCAERGVGVLAKRALANAVWRLPEAPEQADQAIYWQRLRDLGLQPGQLSWPELALRFCAHAPGVGCAIAGTRSVLHLKQDLEAVERGPLPADLELVIRGAFEAHDRGWDGLV